MFFDSGAQGMNTGIRIVQLAGKSRWLSRATPRKNFGQYNEERLEKREETLADDERIFN